MDHSLGSGFEPTNGRLRIATIWRKRKFSRSLFCTMATVRWLRISGALARLGFQVDMINDGSDLPAIDGDGLRFVSWTRFDWRRYDVIKTLFHSGFDALESEGGLDHPFIISKLGSVVGEEDTAEGVHFFGRERQDLYETQKKIDTHSRCVTLLTKQSRTLWEECHGAGKPILLVPTGVDKVLPPRGENPFREFPEKIAVYIGNLYPTTQREINLLWQERLVGLGRCLRKRGIRLCVIGQGRMDRLDPAVVTWMGPVENSRIWDYHYFADVGVVLAQGQAQHNESSKLYYYLRAGLPVVSEAPVPNNHLLEHTGLGSICDYGDNHQMAEAIEAAAGRNWDTQGAIEHMLEHHTWDARAKVYATLLRELLPN